MTQRRVICCKRHQPNPNRIDRTNVRNQVCRWTSSGMQGFPTFAFSTIFPSKSARLEIKSDKSTVDISHSLMLRSVADHISAVMRFVLATIPVLGLGSVGG